MHFITTEEAAEKLYTTAYTIRKYIREGKLLASRIGKQYLIPFEEIERLLKSYQVPSTQQRG